MMSSKAVTVFECDVCGRPESHEPNSRPSGWARVEQWHMSFDLCSPCALPVMQLVREKHPNYRRNAA